MRKIVLFIAFLTSLVCAHAETLILRTGARVKGEILIQNDEVVIVRDAETGARFQYPRAEVQDILADDTVMPDSTPIRNAAEEEDITSSKKVSIDLELSGGAVVIPGNAAGGGFGADLIIGSHHIGWRHIFVGAGLGYHGMFAGGKNYNFLPIQAAVRMPLMEQKHAPVFGAALGYGIALSKDYIGGLYAGLDFGYRCQINPKTAVAVVAYAHFQQATVKVVETVDGEPFVNKTGRNIVNPGVKIMLFF